MMMMMMMMATMMMMMSLLATDRSMVGSHIPVSACLSPDTVLRHTGALASYTCGSDTVSLPPCRNS